MKSSETYGKSIITVKGPVEKSEFGFCHGHDHLFIENGQSFLINPALRMDEPEKTIQELNLFKEAGGQSIVDAQPLGCGRMEKELLAASQTTGVNIVASTGFHKLDFYPEHHWIYSTGEEKLSEIFIRELTEGMFEDTNRNFPSHRMTAKAGVIKVASGADGISGTYRKLFSAAAIAAKETGAPVLTHLEMGKGAFEQVEFFTRRGVEPNAIILSHLDRKIGDMTYHREVAETGVFLEFDTIGRFKYHSDEEEVSYIAKMVESGFEDKILLGLDSTRERMKSYGGSIGLDYLLKHFIPLLKSYGLSEAIIHKFTIQNPANAFSNRKLL